MHTTVKPNLRLRPSFPRNPLTPPLLSLQRRPKALHPKSKLLAAHALTDAEMTPFFDQFIIDNQIKDTTGAELSNFVNVVMWGGRLNAVWTKDIDTFIHSKKHVMRYLRSLESDR